MTSTTDERSTWPKGLFADIGFGAVKQCGHDEIGVSSGEKNLVLYIGLETL
jgi:hypothetical protein